MKILTSHDEQAADKIYMIHLYLKYTTPSNSWSRCGRMGPSGNAQRSEKSQIMYVRNKRDITRYSNLRSIKLFSNLYEVFPLSANYPMGSNPNRDKYECGFGQVHRRSDLYTQRKKVWNSKSRYIINLLSHKRFLSHNTSSQVKRTGLLPKHINIFVSWSPGMGDGLAFILLNLELEKAIHDYDTLTRAIVIMNTQS